MPVFLPYQRRWHYDKSPLKLIEKSRRIGISWSTAFEAIKTASSYGKQGSDVWYAAYTHDAGVEFMRDVFFWLDGISKGLSITEKNDVLKESVTFPSGYKIQAVTSKPRSLRGKKGYIIIDEAAHHDELKDVLVSAKATNIWGTGRIALISTHFGNDNDFCRTVEDVVGGKLEGSHHRVTFDDAIRDGFYKQICKMNGRQWSAEEEKKWRDDWIKFYGEAADEELLCIPSTGGGAYFNRSLIDACATIPLENIIRLKNSGGLLDDPSTRQGIVRAWCEGELYNLLSRVVDRSLPCYLGLDFARETDLSVLVGLLKTKEGKRVTAFVIEMRNIPHASQFQICEYVCKKVTLAAGGFDATGNGSYLAEAINDQYGSIEKVLITTQWYVDTMPKLKAAIEGRFIELPADEDSIDDLMQVRLHNGIPKLVTGRRRTESGARHGDFAIALALAYSASAEGSMDRFDALIGEVKKRGLAG